jgi:D-2-hydroxyacid dehydrogenase (NADP+)
MNTNLPHALNVVTLANIDDTRVERIKDIAPGRLKVIKLWDDLSSELPEQWPQKLVDRFLRDGPKEPRFTPEERERILQEAHIIFWGYPYPKNLFSRTRKLLWVHCPFAGVSNLLDGDLWNAPVTVTTSRGYSSALPIAEVVMGSVYMFAKNLHLAARNSQNNRFDFRDYRMTLVTGKTIGIVGLGGIGQQVARLAKGAGMRVLATRYSAKEHQFDVNGADEVFPANDMNAMLQECDYVAVCTIWTNETEHLMSTEAFQNMKPSAFLINIARGEIVDEVALLSALEKGEIAGAYLDVWEDEFNRIPDPALSALDNVVLTPHVSQMSDVSHAFGFERFLENLDRFLKGATLENVVDWTRGY